LGYTHYWQMLRNATLAEWAIIQKDVGEILAHVEARAEVKLANGMGDRGSKPEIDRDSIRFNGSGDEAYETFAVDRKRNADSSWFCKTAREPYDIAVTAVLCYLSTFHLMGEIDEVRKPLVRVTSDGEGEDFLAGLDIAKIALPHLGNVLDLPMGVMEEDRWCGPWMEDRYCKSYEFRFCIDGHAYVRRHHDNMVFRFHTHEAAARWAAQFHERQIRVESSWMGVSYEGGHGKSLFEPSGSFNKTRTARWAASSRPPSCTCSFRPAAGLPATFGELGHEPPAYVRPGQILAERPTNAYYLRDLLKQTEAA
jgi:hypothetical protein